MKTKAKKKIKSVATLKRKKAVGRADKVAQKMVANGCSKKEAMLDAGYSPSYAHNSQKLTRTRKWKEIMDDKLSVEMIAEVHAGLAKASKLEQSVFPKNMEDDLIRLMLVEVGCIVMKIFDDGMKKIVFYRAPDSIARKGAVDMAYKLRGSYAAEKFEDVNPLAKLTNAELADKRKALIKFLLKK